MNKNDSLGNRMKDYENSYRLYLPKRQAVIVRIDGRVFHSFTKGFNRPYDTLFASCMWQTTKQLCENIGGCVFGYTQSDEISLVLVDYKDINTEPWFGNNLQKIVSVSASMATLFFNQAFAIMIKNEGTGNGTCLAHTIALEKRQATFDSRAFIIPREEVLNYFYFRQLDCKRNSIQLLGQAHFSHNQLQNKNCDEIQEMLWQEHEINWANEPNWFKNGVSIYKKSMEVEHTMPDGTIVKAERNKWFVDRDTPVFTQNKDFINKHIGFKE